MVIEENECGALLYAYGTEITNTHRFECHCGGENISECIGLPPEFLITLFKLLCSISYQTIPQTYLCKYDKYLCRRNHHYCLPLMQDAIGLHLYDDINIYHTS